MTPPENQNIVEERFAILQVYCFNQLVKNNAVRPFSIPANRSTVLSVSIRTMELKNFLQNLAHLIGVGVDWRWSD